MCIFTVCTLGFGSLNHGIWPLIRVSGTQHLRLQFLKDTNLKSGPGTGCLASLPLQSRLPGQDLLVLEGKLGSGRV